MVNHYIHVTERAADYKIMINSHEAVQQPMDLHTYQTGLLKNQQKGTGCEP
jgi:hypothetical protein